VRPKHNYDTQINEAQMSEAAQSFKTTGNITAVRGAARLKNPVRKNAAAQKRLTKVENAIGISQPEHGLC